LEGQEGSQEPHGTQLQRESQPRVITSPLPDQLTVGLIQRKEPLQLRMGRLTGETPVGRRLIIGQKLNRHILSSIRSTRRYR
jgi:hypothetical protein